MKEMLLSKFKTPLCCPVLYIFRIWFYDDCGQFNLHLMISSDSLCCTYVVLYSTDIIVLFNFVITVTMTFWKDFSTTLLVACMALATVCGQCAECRGPRKITIQPDDSVEDMYYKSCFVQLSHASYSRNSYTGEMKFVGYRLSKSMARRIKEIDAEQRGALRVSRRRGKVRVNYWKNAKHRIRRYHVTWQKLRDLRSPVCWPKLFVNTLDPRPLSLHPNVAEIKNLVRKIKRISKKLAKERRRSKIRSMKRSIKSYTTKTQELLEGIKHPPTMSTQGVSTRKGKQRECTNELVGAPTPKAAAESINKLSDALDAASTGALDVFTGGGSVFGSLFGSGGGDSGYRKAKYEWRCRTRNIVIAETRRGLVRVNRLPRSMEYHIFNHDGKVEFLKFLKRKFQGKEKDQARLSAVEEKLKQLQRKKEADQRLLQQKELERKQHRRNRSNRRRRRMKRMFGGSTIQLGGAGKRKHRSSSGRKHSRRKRTGSHRGSRRRRRRVHSRRKHRRRRG
jgi:hypothetical protein